VMVQKRTDARECQRRAREGIGEVHLHMDRVRAALSSSASSRRPTFHCFYVNHSDDPFDGDSDDTTIRILSQCVSGSAGHELQNEVNNAFWIVRAVQRLCPGHISRKRVCATSWRLSIAQATWPARDACNMYSGEEAASILSRVVGRSAGEAAFGMFSKSSAARRCIVVRAGSISHPVTNDPCVPFLCAVSAQNATESIVFASNVNSQSAACAV
jgi:hypothetical protein